MRLENRIVMYGYRSDETEIDGMAESVYLREKVKKRTCILTALAAILSSVLCIVVIGFLGISMPWSTLVWAMICLCGVAGATITWLFCWPFAGRSEYWQNAIDFIEAIRYVESVTGKPFENWSILNNSVEKAVEKALVLELEAIFALQEKDHRKAGEAYAKWLNRHSQMRRLFPSIAEVDIFTTPQLFGPFNPESDVSAPA